MLKREKDERKCVDKRERESRLNREGVKFSHLLSSFSLFSITQLNNMAPACVHLV